MKMLMRTKVKSFFQLLLQSPRRFPVEAALGLAFFIIAVCNTATSEWNETTGRMESIVNGDILWLFVPLMALTFWLHRTNRWAYIASFFLFVPLMALDLHHFLWTYGFTFTYVLAALLLVMGNRRLDNRSFAAHALHVVTQVFFGLLIAGIFNAAVVAVVASFLYIFGIDSPQHLYEYIIEFVWFVVAPQVCCTLIRQDEDEVAEPANVLRLILDYILSPAVIIYTVILYAYFIKIAIEWDLPKGGVAWMVMAFITLALAGRMAQCILSRRHYDWFYDRFPLIAIPPLIMYWIGSIYRIRLYGFTEGRFYLMVAGGLMTLFVLMLLWERTRRFQLMALILGAAIIVFTYIPGISAKSIGLSSQKQRLADIIRELKLVDAKTGKLNNAIDLRSIKQDSLLCEKYKDASSVISYVRKAMGTDAFNNQYGEWTHQEYEFNVNRVDYDESNCHYRTMPVELGQYGVMLPEEHYRCSLDSQTVIVRNADKLAVVEYPICDIIRQDSTLIHHPEQLLTYSNDSLLLVLGRIYIVDGQVTDISSYDFHLFRRN